AAFGALRVLLCDTAGIREDACETERAGMRRSEEQLLRADVIVVVLDGAAPLDREDEAVLGRTATSTAPIVVALNKIDLAPAFAPRDLVMPGAILDPAWLARRAGSAVRVAVNRVPQPGEPVLVAVSATSGDGIEALAAALYDALPGGAAEPSRDTLLV